MKSLLRFLYYLHFFISYFVRCLRNILYCGPIYKARCESVGKGLRMWSLPGTDGPTRIRLGDDVSMSGHFGAGSGGIFDEPRLVIGDRVDLGDDVQITANKEVIVEADVKLEAGVRIMDTDAHPRDTESRVKGLPPPRDEIKPVRICRGAWIGERAFILRGVTIGEGAVVGAQSVVLTNVPPYTLVMGVPARVMVRDVRRSTA